jgi:3-phosphoshikimate 1-carboxyvinyltransferase
VKKVSLTPCPPVSGSIRPPGSKSITNRALICAALAVGDSRLTGVLDSEDTSLMIGALSDLGVRVDHCREEAEVCICGTGGHLPVQSAKLFLGNSGTSIRFLTAALAACQGSFMLDGVPRMRQRPISDLMDALNQLGGTVSSMNLEDPSCPPVLVQAGGLQGGIATVAGNISSQYLSGLMLASPLARTNVQLEVTGKLVSTPYVAMTAAVMRHFGAQVSMQQERLISVEAGKGYHGTDYGIEPDASAASYFWAAAAVTGGRAKVEGLTQDSLQGDVGFCKVLEKMGCKVEYLSDAIEVIVQRPLVGVDVDMSDISDTVQTLAAVALFATGPTTVRGVAHNRVKETDRITDLSRELVRLGAEVTEFEDGLRIFPPQRIRSAELETYNDHRMAMSLALVGLKTEGIVIKDPDCTAKTYPGYWRDLSQFTGSRITTN